MNKTAVSHAQLDRQVRYSVASIRFRECQSQPVQSHPDRINYLKNSAMYVYILYPNENSIII